MEKVGDMFDTLSKMYGNLGTLAGELCTYFDSEMQPDGEISKLKKLLDFTIYF